MAERGPWLARAGCPAARPKVTSEPRFCPTPRPGEHLHIDAPVRALAQGREGVGAVGRVEVRAGRNGVLPIGMRVAGFAL